MKFYGEILAVIRFICASDDDGFSAQHDDLQKLHGMIVEIDDMSTRYAYIGLAMAFLHRWNGVRFSILANPKQRGELEVSFFSEGREILPVDKIKKTSIYRLHQTFSREEWEEIIGGVLESDDELWRCNSFMEQNNIILKREREEPKRD